MKRFYSLVTKEKEFFQFLTDTRCPLMNSIGMVRQPWNVSVLFNQLIVVSRLGQ